MITKLYRMEGAGLVLYTHAISPLEAAKQGRSRYNTAKGNVTVGRANFGEGEGVWIEPPQVFNIAKLEST